MAHSFKSIIGNKSFGAFSEPNDAGDYISKKKARASFCVANNCVPAIKVGTQSNLLLFNKSNMLSVYPCKNSINKANLNINLITQLDLSGASIIKDFTTSMYSANINGINPNILPYLTYNVDPEGDLFANTRRNINNFVNYMVYSPPIMSQTLTQIQTQEPYVINNGIFTMSSTINYNTLITFNYTNNANSVIKFNKNLQIFAFVVGGGGGGGGSNVTGQASGGGGGGGGEVLFKTIFVSAGSVYTIVIGSGGTGGTGGGSNAGKNGNTGNNSFIVLNNNNIIITAKGGLGGIGNSSYYFPSYTNYNVPHTLCNGGASGNGSLGGIGGVTNNNIFSSSGNNAVVGGGGGGGGCYYAGKGGNGSLNISIPIYGTTFGAGGGGGAWGGPKGTGGNSNAGDGGGSYSSAAVSGKQNTGGGGGGGGSVTGGNGGSGVIILAFNV